MPLTKTGKKVLKKMKQQYGEKEGEAVFYATMKKNGAEEEQEKKPSKDDGQTSPDVQIYHKKLSPLKGTKKKEK